ncbi:hypothetical protein CYMTET_2506 [Cymbomonas tetramitiformis]|uniref:Uncharacterized protein n=1 Tax=Cymbomonas tetramitiformis TaxID=36881 RepID=A0AAE0H509_9CHLO|nr:hypothetical protein CYMTET_37357 [Cymbomonas tetramitiformis]KAK3290038.1 hypothetical protein CYMTET_2506 [Cymbomonas tetramitiformis]
MSDQKKRAEELQLLTSLLQSLGWSGPSDTTIYNGMPNFDTDKTKQSISAWYKYKKKKMKVADNKSVEATVKGWLDATDDLNKYSYRDETLPCAETRVRADFWYLTEDHSVVLEVDEHHHQSYEVTCEIVRMQKLHDQRPEYPLHLIRFNPHCDDPFKRETLLKTLRDAIAMPNRSRNEPSGILVEYIGYPRSRERLMRTTRELLLRNVGAANSRGALLADRDGGDRAEAAERMRRCASDLVDAYEAYKNACRECVHAGAIS